MEEIKKDEYRDAFAKKQLKSIKRELPSADFTSKIMDEILVTQNIEVFEYKPLISKKSWFALAAGIFGMLFYVFLKSSEFDSANSKYAWLPKFSIYDFIELPNISPVVGYTCLVLCFSIVFQVLFLSNTIHRITVN